MARPILDPDEDRAVLEDRPKLNISTDKVGNLLQRVSPVENLLDRHPPVTEALGVEEVVLVKADAEADPEILWLARVLDHIKELRLEVLLCSSVEHH